MLDHPEFQSEDDAPDRSKHETKEEGAKALTSVPSTFGPSYPPPSPPSETNSLKESSQWRDNVKLGIELMGLAALIVYTIFSILQWAQIRWTNRLTRESLNGSTDTLNRTLEKMQKQIDAANTANENTARMFQANFIMWTLISGERGHINVAFKNIGRMTASDVSAKANIDIVSIRSGAIITQQSVAKQLGAVQPEGSPDRALWLDIPKYVNSDGIGTDSELSPYLGDKVVYIKVSLRYNGGFGKFVDQGFCKAVIADTSVNGNHNLFPEMPECGDAPYYINLRKKQIASETQTNKQ